ncbi:hypothetical protein [Peribacillus aracenensis]|uniref:hypothetical protein n=1 Tax=Peribacillus aracenensis TaxID=2976708 RepID=UPI0021A39096|nr:hypothetical protein [Peribacillus sp. BBB004]
MLNTDTIMDIHCAEERINIYIALEDINYEWSKVSILQVLDLWNAGFSLNYISEEVQREYDEVALLIMDLDDYLFHPRSRNVQLSEPLKNLSPRYYGNKRNFFKNIDEEYLVFTNIGDEVIWNERDVIMFESLWNTGYSIETIAADVKRTEFEVILLVIDRCRLHRIKPRESGLGGHENH